MKKVTSTPHANETPFFKSSTNTSLDTTQKVLNETTIHTHPPCIIPTTLPALSRISHLVRWRRNERGHEPKERQRKWVGWEDILTNRGFGPCTGSRLWHSSPDGPNASSYLNTPAGTTHHEEATILKNIKTTKQLPHHSPSPHKWYKGIIRVGFRILRLFRYSIGWTSTVLIQLSTHPTTHTQSNMGLTTHWDPDFINLILESHHPCCPRKGREWQHQTRAPLERESKYCEVLRTGIRCNGGCIRYEWPSFVGDHAPFFPPSLSLSFSPETWGWWALLQAVAVAPSSSPTQVLGSDSEHKRNWTQKNDTFSLSPPCLSSLCCVCC